MKKPVVSTPLETTNPSPNPSVQIKKPKSKKSSKELKKSKIINSQLLASDEVLLADDSQILYTESPEYPETVANSSGSSIDNSLVDCIKITHLNETIDVSTDVSERTAEEGADVSEIDDSGIYTCCLYALYFLDVLGPYSHDLELLSTYID